MNRIILRNALIEDITDIYEIEKLSFSNPWNIALISSEIRNIHAICRVLMIDKDIKGYCFARLIFDECQLMDIAVHPSCRGCGYGTRLLHDLFTICNQCKVKDVFLEVRKTSSAVSFYQKVGFIHYGMRKNYYINPEDDAVLMRYHLDSNSHDCT